MRPRRTITTGAVALAALMTLTACGSDEGSAAAGPLEGLPKAQTMADVQKAVQERGVACGKLRQSGDNSYMEKEAKDPEWGIQERAVCRDDSGRSVTLLLIGDMAKFQGALAKGSRSFTIGQNFGVAAESDYASQSLMQNGLLTVSCDPDDRQDVPSGFEIHEGLVKPCFLTNYDA
ncbi:MULTISPECIES: hypothetical protein [unclassified Streptomyces]|uniref:hypothetical protein n=1 Tax=Streptomyces sp. NPDC127129 TaxID=3345373 RepID=UPI00363E786D